MYRLFEFIRKVTEAEPTDLPTLGQQMVAGAVGGLAGPFAGIVDIAWSDLSQMISKVQKSQSVNTQLEDITYANVRVPYPLVGVAMQILGDEPKEIWTSIDMPDASDYNTIYVGNRNTPYIAFKSKTTEPGLSLSEIWVYAKGLDIPIEKITIKDVNAEGQEIINKLRAAGRKIF